MFSRFATVCSMLALAASVGIAAAKPSPTASCCVTKTRCCDKVEFCCDQPDKAECCKTGKSCCDMKECCGTQSGAKAAKSQAHKGHAAKGKSAAKSCCSAPAKSAKAGK